MEDQVVLLGDPKKFMVNSIANSMEKGGLKATVVEMTVNAVSHIEEGIGIYILYLEEEPNPDCMVYLKDLVNDRGTMLYLIGDQNTVGAAKKYFSSVQIAGEFLRPLNVKDLLNAVELGLEKETRKKEQKKILVVDDDGTMLRTIKSWLDGHYRVSMVNSGINAITFLAKNQVDLILLDYEMPVTSGPQVLKMLRSEPTTSHIPVMFLTSKGDKESVLKVVGLKPEKYLLKTMPPAELIQNIDEFFASRK